MVACACATGQRLPDIFAIKTTPQVGKLAGEVAMLRPLRADPGDDR
jgi:hypothetical protein